MTTQNLEYKEIAETSPIVATALKARDDEQLEIDLLYQEIEERKVKLDLLDNNLAIMATMAQECNERVDAISQECNEKMADSDHDRAEENRKVFAAAYDLVETAISTIKGDWEREETNETTFSDAMEVVEEAFSIRVNMDGEIDEDTDNNQEAYDLVP